MLVASVLGHQFLDGLQVGQTIPGLQNLLDITVSEELVIIVNDFVSYLNLQ